MLTALVLVTGLGLFAQDNLAEKAAAIAQEGKNLYRLEMASWYGTDLFLEKFLEKKDRFSGYFSYANGSETCCVLFAKGNEGKILATLRFDSTYSLATAIADGTERPFTALEQALYNLRKAAVAQINSDTLFSHYENTNYNIIPLVDGDVRKVYVLTGTSQNGVILFGNDYLLTYNSENVLQNERRLHKSLIVLKYAEAGKTTISAMHSHLPEMGELMTPTDVCTLMLYQKFTNWKHHLVLSRNFVSLWDCESQQLVLLTREAWEKINKQ